MRLALIVAVLALLAGCAQEFGQCNPGVGDMSRMTSQVPPGNC